MGRAAIRTAVGALLAALLVMPPWSADLLPAPLDQLSPEPAAAQNSQTPVKKGEVIRFTDQNSAVTVSQCAPAPEPYLQEYQKEYPLGYSTSWSVDSGDPHLMTPSGSTQPMHVYPRWVKVSPAVPNDPYHDYLMRPITPSTTGAPRYVIPQWDVHPRDPRLCSVEIPPCPPSPLANPKNQDGRMKLSEDELGICEDVATNSDDPALVDRCLWFDENGNPLGNPSHSVGVLGFVNVYDDGKGECKLRLPSRCPPGLYRISQDSCRGIYRRTWTCPSTHPIRRNQFGTCYSTLDMDAILQGNNMKHPACVDMVPATVVPCERYVGDDFLQNPQSLNEPCKAINGIMGHDNELLIVLEADPDITPKLMGKPSEFGRKDDQWVVKERKSNGGNKELVTYRRIFDDPSKPRSTDPLEPIKPDHSQKLNKHWCEYDKRYLDLDCFDPSPQPPSCNWNSPADEHRAWCVMRASKTGGCDAIARTILCRALQIDLRKAPPNLDAVEAAHEDLQTMNCEPCPPTSPFQRDAGSAGMANCVRKASATPISQIELPRDPADWKGLTVHHARFARQTIPSNCQQWLDKIEDDFRNGIVGSYDPSMFQTDAGDECSNYMCPPLTIGSVSWEPTHVSGRAFTGTPVSLTITHAPFTEVKKRYLQVKPTFWKQSNWDKDHFEKKPNGFETATSADQMHGYMAIALREKTFWTYGGEDSNQRMRLFDIRGDIDKSALDRLSMALASNECFPQNFKPQLSVRIRKLWPDIYEDRKVMCRLFGVESIQLWNDSDPDTPQCPKGDTDMDEGDKRALIERQGYLYLDSPGLSSSSKRDELSRRLRMSTVEVMCEIEPSGVECSRWTPANTGFYEIKAIAIQNLKVLTPNDSAMKPRDNTKGYDTNTSRLGYVAARHGEPLDDYHGLLATLASATPEDGKCRGYSRVPINTPRYMLADKSGPFLNLNDRYISEGTYIKLDSNNKPRYDLHLTINNGTTNNGTTVVWGVRPQEYLKMGDLGWGSKGSQRTGIETDLDCLRFAIENEKEGLGLNPRDVGLISELTGLLPFDQTDTAYAANLCPAVIDIRYNGDCAGVSAYTYMTSEPVGIAVHETMTVSR